jgi:hypothetical protein
VSGIFPVCFGPGGRPWHPGAWFWHSTPPRPLPWVTAPREEAQPLAACLPVLVAESRRGAR